MKITRRLFLSSVASTLALIAALRPSWAQATHSTRITFVLFNDFYIMGEQPFPDGGKRGGFARLAAVIKAERAKAASEGRHVIVAHGGDTLSPSVMSGLDRGAHIVALTNMIGLDIFVPGNHEFDFGKAVFIERMGEAKFPLYAANLRDASGAMLPAFKDRAIFDFNGVRIGLTGLAYEQSPRVSSPEDLRFASTIDTTKQQAAALRADGADFVCAVLHCNRGDAIKLQYDRPAELLLTGHTHDLFVNFDDACAVVEFELRRALRDLYRRRDFGARGQRQAHGDVVAAVSCDRHRDGDARSGRCRRGRALRAGAARQDDRHDRHDRGRARFLDRDGAHARGRDREPVRRRDALGHARRRRDPQWRRHPRRQEPTNPVRASVRATSSPSCRSATASWCWK